MRNVLEALCVAKGADEGTDQADERLDRVDDVARFLSLSRSMVYLLMENGALPYVKFGRARRVPHRAVIALAARGLPQEV